MKFQLKCITNKKIRKGILSDFQRLPGTVLETPLLLLNTKGGSIPHITHEVFQLISKEQHGIQISLPSTIQCYEGVKEYKKGISNFVGLQECMTYCTVQDPSVITPEGYNSTENISIWSRSGRMVLNPDKYMDIMEAFRPDMYQALCNGDTNLTTSKKKNRKVIGSTMKFFQDCLDRHNKSETLQSSCLIGVVEGGYDLEARRLSATFLAQQPVAGFVFDGLHNNGTSIDSINISNVRPIVEVTLKFLPEDKLRIIHGSWKPDSILELVDMGFDVFDSSTAYTLTEKFSAFTFKYALVSLDTEINNSELTSFEISLTDTIYKEDFGPILEGCGCLACRKHTRAYIHHLINNNELLASTLLMIHNLHHYLEFFKFIRKVPENHKIKLFM